MSIKVDITVVLELFPFLLHGSLYIPNLHRLWHWDKLVHQIFLCHRSKPFTSNAILMSFGLPRVLVHRCFRCRNFDSLRQRNKFVNQILMVHRSISFACNVVFVIFR